MLTSTTPQATNSSVLHVGFIYTAPTTDFGWNFRVDQSRLALEKLYSRRVLRTHFEINTDESNLFPAVRRLISNNCTLIFISVNFSGVTINPVATAYPNVHFVLTNGIAHLPNVNSFSVRLSECFYPLGSLAAEMSKNEKQKSAMILQLDNSDTDRAINGYILGAKNRDPDHQLLIYFLKDRSEISAQKLVMQLAAQGIKFITGVMLNDIVARFTTKLGKYTFSFPSDIGRVIYGENVLSGCLIDWVPGFRYFIDRERMGIWQPDYLYRFGWDDGGLELDEFSTEVDDQIIIDTTEASSFLNNSYTCLFSRETLEANGLGDLYNASDFDIHGCLVLEKLMNFSHTFEGIVDVGHISEEEMIVPIFVQWSSASTITLIAVVCVSSIIIMFSIVLVAVFRKRVIIAVTNEYFCYSILIGSLLGYVSLFFWMGEPTDSLCVTRVWFLDIAACFIFGSIAAKTYRIWRLWTHPDLRETSRSGKFVFGMIFGLGFLQAVLLSILTAVNGYHVDRTFQQEGLNFDEYFLSCSLTTSGIILVSLILASNGVVIVLCGILAYVSKNVSEKYNETSSIVLSIYSILVATTVALLLFVNIKTADPRRQIIFVATGVYIAVTCPLISIFGPKFKTLLSEYSFSSTPTSSVMKGSASTHQSGASKASGKQEMVSSDK